MAVVSLSGVLLAAFVPTFVKHIKLSKIAEATEQLDALHRAAAAYYVAERRVGNRVMRGCLPESAGPAPNAPSPDPVPFDFTGAETKGRATWLALGQGGERAVRYAYSVVTLSPGCGPHAPSSQPVITFRAEGDLDGDGVRSTVERSAAISSQHELVPLPPLRIHKRVE